MLEAASQLPDGFRIRKRGEQRGAQGAQITVETYGESRPTSDNSLGQGIWMNRRVTLSVADVEGRVISDQGIAPALLAPGPSVLDLENDAS